ncbi:SRPBCC family protein [Solirubrobacter ginsenosidimutans]|uniref:SRPBCC family protein n=1 Tax=Solirubrobacter ginsenosidimutans TaxID=490573 RepID=A0A9X3MZL4_9ACTN|nr:SRPBCC family protein [Solirubrobacter ginsenosidimutans]MDA0164195.1 SRPBCC family protein [Solirubrobacter ginsenosidimutans]
MSTETATNTTQVYRVYIRTTPERVWDAITQPEWTERYGYGGVADFDLRPGGRAIQRPGAAMKAYPGVPDVIVDGEILESDPPRKLVQTWRMLMDPAMEAEGFTRLTHEIEPIDGGVTKLTVTHELEGAPALASMVAGESESSGAGGGWAWVLSDLKTLLESGEAMAQR